MQRYAYFVDQFFGQGVFFKEHHHIDRSVEYPVRNCEHGIVEDNGVGYCVLAFRQDMVQCPMPPVVLAAFHLYGKGVSIFLHDKVDFAMCARGMCVILQSCNMVYFVILSTP